ncbi:MAG: hypothetical protein GAK28_00016 [Luteibacter sp.]|uniref:DUF3224 domain-containing protein n=1 Tax=Luteibacter sp. TaxID=1886636 RepID=UPI0013857547|nr:DUF3224 domain-containing protein [Luteibacter sp.]KAF1009379.1 MAG: hypothetical protein GAK28_00016 [Luteibacter sp.]
MTLTAYGVFDVKILPAGTAEGAVDHLGTLALDKHYHGDLDAAAKGHMLTAVSASVKGSAAYVAVERVDGTLHGRKGAFSLVHRGIMSGNSRELHVSIVPDSGEGGLQGIAGTLQIVIDADGTHRYELDYTLPSSP